MSDGINEYVTAGAEDLEADPRAAEEVITSGEQSDPLQSVEQLRRELEESRQDAALHQEKFLRVRADMENYKKRMERTYADRAHSSKKDLLQNLLGVKDNLERALHYAGSSEAGGESLIEGVRLTQYQLNQMLQKEGVEPIAAEGQPFDPRLEEAIQTVNDPSVDDHTVVQVVRTGYTYGDEVLRPAQVIVSVHGGNS
jgi:molecular chaperone GrpE